MGIPIGKLQLYTACAAVPPDVLLPIHMDVGTTNQSLINDPLYLGLRWPRISDDEVNEVVDEFVDAVQEVFPGCCIHFEDWKGTDAMRLLARYRDKVSCYNDDIQGTAGVTLAGLISALRITGGKLSDQRILFLGAGSAGIGIANLLASAMTLEGLSEQDARARISLFDINGLIEPSRTDLFDFQKPYAHPHAPSRDFVEDIKSLEPTAIVGVSTKGKAFTREVVEAMADLNERPVIFALSNPTDHAECTAEEALTWSNGRALYAAGVQFPPVRIGDKTYVTGQANNLYIFPAVGLAIYATGAKRVTDEMFITAAKAVADQVTRAELDSGAAVPAAYEHPPDRGGHGDPGLRGHLRPQAGRRRAAQVHQVLRRVAGLHARLRQRHRVVREPSVREGVVMGTVATNGNLHAVPIGTDAAGTRTESERSRRVLRAPTVPYTRARGGLQRPLPDRSTTAAGRSTRRLTCTDTW